MGEEQSHPRRGSRDGESAAPAVGPVLDRRRLLLGGGVAGLGMLAGPLMGRASASTARSARSGPLLVRQAAVAVAPPAEQLHLQFGADASSAMVASWVTPDLVMKPRLRLGTPAGGLGSVVHADERVYAEAISGETVFTYHAAMEDLDADTDFIYEVLAEGADPVRGKFRTGPDGRAAFRFSSFGDQSIPTKVGPGALTGPWTPNAGYIVDAVEAKNPLFHLLNGDLCYANVSDDPVATWRSFFNNNMRSARNRPWMPTAGNHEIEVGNGRLGFDAYQTRFDLPDAREEWELRALWYRFRVG